MIRLLVIGRSATSWGEKLLALAPDITVDVARLPAAGIRQLAKTPPDAVFVVEATHAERVSMLVEAVRQQPLGALTPIIAHGDGLDPTLDVQALLSGADGPSEVLRALEEALELEIGELTAEADAVVTLESPRGSATAGIDADAPQPSGTWPPETTSTRGTSATTAPSEPTETQPARIETPKFILEEIVDDEPPGPRALDRAELFATRPRGRSQSDVEDATVKRMLRSVRHEDYYAILGVHRGAETPAIRDAYYRQIERFDPQNVDVDIAHRNHLELSEIRDALEDAWAVLGDADLRADYLNATIRA
jgi:hypothetical protein